jgi:hypothetical protein
VGDAGFRGLADARWDAEGLDAPKGVLIILDRGIAMEENVSWLKEHGYRYLVMARGGKREGVGEEAKSFTSTSFH